MPPAAVWTGSQEPSRRFPKKGFSRVWTLERVRAEPAVLPAAWPQHIMCRNIPLHTPRPQRARPTSLTGKPPPIPAPPTIPQNRARFFLTQRLCPLGQTASPTHLRSTPLPRRGTAAGNRPAFLLPPYILSPAIRGIAFNFPRHDSGTATPPPLNPQHFKNERSSPIPPIFFAKPHKP